MRYLFAVTLDVTALSASAQERITLTAPETTPSNTAYRLDRMTLIFNDSATPADEGFLHIQLTGIDKPDNHVQCSYTPTTNPTATFLLTALQKSNLSSAYNNNATTGSLKQRVHHRLVVMGEAAAVCSKSLAGTLSGSPE